MDDASERASHSWAFITILGAFLCLSILYNVSIPLYESPDELHHAAFVSWLADKRHLPVITAEEQGPWLQEGAQPPLYYWLAATLVGSLPHKQAEALASPNRYANIGEPLRPDNKNRVLHDLQQESSPSQPEVLFPHLLRLVSTVLAVGTLWAIYQVGRLTFPNRHALALGMMGLVAFMPQFLFLSASVNNDNMIILVATLTLVLLVTWLRTPQLPNRLQVGALGALLGLGPLAKLGGLLLWPLALGTMVRLAWRAHNLRWLVLATVLAFGLASAICGWWFVRNQQLYGDPSGISAHIGALGGERRDLPTRLQTILGEFRGFRYSFWALFGWFNILTPDPFYWLMDGLTLLGLVGFGLFLIRSLPQYPQFTREIVILALAWLGLVVVGLLRWTMLVKASQGRLIYPALGAIALILVVGWAELIPRRLRQPLGIVALGVWATCAALVALLVLQPAYALPERVRSLDELEVTPSGLDVRYGTCCELVGYVPPEQPAHPGDWVPLTLVWQGLAPIEQDYTFYVHARTIDGELAGQLDTYHGNGMYPTSQWQPGEILVDTIHVPISANVEAPTLVRFNTGLADAETGQRLPVYAPDGTELEAVFAGEAALVPLQWPKLPPESPVDAVFEEKIRLGDLHLPDTRVRPGMVVTVTVHWQALTTIEEDYTGYIHLVDHTGANVTQDDHPPLNGRYPTRLWSQGTVVADRYRLQLPSDLEAGRYELWAGFYRPASVQRLRAVSAQTGKRWKDDQVYLGSLVVAHREP